MFILLTAVLKLSLFSTTLFAGEAEIQRRFDSCVLNKFYAKNPGPETCEFLDMHDVPLAEIIKQCRQDLRLSLPKGDLSIYSNSSRNITATGLAHLNSDLQNKAASALCGRQPIGFYNSQFRYEMPAQRHQGGRAILRVTTSN